MKSKLEEGLENGGVELTSENDAEREMLKRLWCEHGRPAMFSRNDDGSVTLAITPTLEE